jgi:DNA (cytosine-5)-methyltransferase 1
MSHSPLARSFRAIDLFAGAGGTTLALKRAGFDVPVAVEIDPAKADTLHRNQPATKVLGANGTCGDVTKLGAGDIARSLPGEADRCDVVVGCPPCQGYSLQGSRNPRDPRNRLFEDLLRLAISLRPSAVVMENVPGMGSLSGGRFLSSFLSGLEGAGYSTTIWNLRASDFGVPQCRERLFAIGMRDGELLASPKKVSPPTVWQAIADLPTAPYDVVAGGQTHHDYPGPAMSAYASALRGRKRRVSGVAVTRHDPGVSARLARLKVGQVDPQTRHRRLDPNGLATTITAGSRMRTACRPVHPYEGRVLTVREAARLASFPDWYEFPDNIAEAWSQIGNAVPPLMAQAVFESVRDALISGQ